MNNNNNLSLAKLAQIAVEGDPAKHKEIQECVDHMQQIAHNALSFLSIYGELGIFEDAKLYNNLIDTFGLEEGRKDAPNDDSK